MARCAACTRAAAPGAYRHLPHGESVPAAERLRRYRPALHAGPGVPFTPNLQNSFPIMHRARRHQRLRLAESSRWRTQSSGTHSCASICGNRAQKPAQVVAGGTADGVQRVAQCALQPTAVHSVIRLQVSNRWLNGLAPTQPAFLLRTQTLELAPVNDLFVRVVGVHTPESKIDHHLLDLYAQVLRYVCGLLQHRAQNVAVVGIAGEGACAQHQAMPV